MALGTAVSPQTTSVAVLPGGTLLHRNPPLALFSETLRVCCWLMAKAPACRSRHSGRCAAFVSLPCPRPAGTCAVPAVVTEPGCAF